MKSPIVWVLLAVIVILGILYFTKKNTTPAAVNNMVVQPQSQPICVPFTKSDQDAEKRQKLANCTNKLLIPIVGEVQYAACVANVKSTLTPIKNC